MPKGEVHGKGGGRGEVGCFWDGDGGALEVGSGGVVDLGLKHDLVIKHERERVSFLMLTRQFLCMERKRTEKRLLLRAGTWRTLVNSTSWTGLPLIVGLNKTFPMPSE